MEKEKNYRKLGKLKSVIMIKQIKVNNIIY